MPLRRILDCPYCPRRGTGVIAVDPDAIAAHFDAGNKEYHRYDQPADPPTVVFNPDGFPNRPCPHLISCYLDADVVTMVPDSERTRHLAVSGGTDHAWFLENDRNDELNIYLWTELADGNCDAYDPTTPYVRRRVERHYRYTAARPGVALLAEFILAMDALRFCEELRWGYYARSVT